MMKKLLMVSICLLIVMILPSLLMAQGGPADPSDTFVPIDGGIALLLAAGVGYGAKKLIEHRDKFYREE